MLPNQLIVRHSRPYSHSVESQRSKKPARSLQMLPVPGIETQSLPILLHTRPSSQSGNDWPVLSLYPPQFCPSLALLSGSLQVLPAPGIETLSLPMLLHTRPSSQSGNDWPVLSLNPPHDWFKLASGRWQVLPIPGIEGTPESRHTKSVWQAGNWPAFASSNPLQCSPRPASYPPATTE